MPQQFSYTILPDPCALPPPPTVGGVSFPPSSPAISCDFAIRITQADLLCLFERLVPIQWLAPIRDIGPGYELLQAYGKQFERISTAIARLQCGSYILSASGGTKATVTVEFFRDNANAGAITINKGTIVTTSDNDRRFLTTSNVILAASGVGSLSVQVEAEAVASGWQWNVPGPVPAMNGELLPGSIDTVIFLDMTPPYGDPTICARQVDDAVGGAAPMLDGLGNDRGIVRSGGETDPQLVVRIRTLPDTVSPDAMKRAVYNYLSKYLTSPTFTFIETFRLDYQTCWDANQVSGSTPSSPQGAFDTNVFVYDDPRPPVPFKNRWLDEVEYRGTFIVLLPLFGVNDVGMAYDDTAMNPAQHATAGAIDGRHGWAAYDVPSTANSVILQGGYDGFDVGAKSVVKGLFDLLQSIKPAGVAAIIEREGE